MNAVIVLISILVSCNAGSNYKKGSKGIHFGAGGYVGGVGGVGGVGFGGLGGIGGAGGGGGLGGAVGGLLGGGEGLLGGGGVGGGGLLGGGVYGPVGGGTVGGIFRSAVKYGTCPNPNEVDSQQIGPYCFNDDGCHGSQKCCQSNVYGGYRCQIPLEYQRPGSCNSNFIDYPFYSTRRACNDDTICPFFGKCCRRRSSGQIDTCTYPFFGPYQPALGGLGGSYSPGGVGGGSFGPVGGGSFGPVGGSGVVSPLLPVLPQGSFKKKY
ncbi:shematrin-like protein 2 [Saccostrea echinata]|uniref:shematrin-like protein 2 n=1 Tax=Saccostrea echinata TaxID=191078 RepID=UPI002A837CAC|nr:shematrin-like protein 2 [Saccostrea echinata]